MMMDRFVELREKGRPAAWRQLQEDLHKYTHILAPAVIALKDLMNLSMEIEGFLKGANEKVGKTSEETLRDFLNTGQIAGSPVAYQPPDFAAQAREVIDES